MTHTTPLIAILVASFGLAFIFGYIANYFKISPIVGYLLAGVMIGPSTPGYTANHALASELAEIGVILLMFGVGLHFSLKDLDAVKRIAVPGAIAQIIIATLMGVGFSYAVGWSFTAGLFYGLALSVASTVVLLRALEEHNLIKTVQGRIAIGWLVVEDLAVIIILIFLPAFASLTGHHLPSSKLESNVLLVFTITLIKASTFIILMLVFGRRYLPRILSAVARKGSDELFRLSVLAIALVIAFIAANLFGLSFALGAFFAGMFLSESKLSHRAAQETLSFRDAFAIIFFVSVGMLFRPEILLDQPFLVLMTVFIIIIGKSLGAFLIVRLFGYPRSTAFTVSASLAQIGEFSFILAQLGFELKILSEQAKDLILAGSFISIMLNPLFFAIINRFIPKRRKIKRT